MRRLILKLGDYSILDTTIILAILHTSSSLALPDPEFGVSCWLDMYPDEMYNRQAAFSFAIFLKRSDTSDLLVVLVVVTVHAIWRAHWNFVSKECAFLAGMIAARASSVMLQNLHQYHLRLAMAIRLFPLLFLISFVGASTYQKDQPIALYYNKLFTYGTHLPIAYSSPSFLCPPIPSRNALFDSTWLAMERDLRGDRPVQSDLNIVVGQDMQCQTVCSKGWSVEDAMNAKQFIENDYQVEWWLDGLPGATVSYTNKVSTRSYRVGFPLGQVLNGQTYINNHVAIHVLYTTDDNDNHDNEVTDKDNDDDYANNSRISIIGFEVYPDSVQNGDCNHPAVDYPKQQVLERKSSIRYTYSVTWKQTTLTDQSRWDKYVLETPPKKNLVATVNSVVVALLLLGVIAVILLKTASKDSFDDVEYKLHEDFEDNVGWRLIHRDVFRRPIYAGLLAPLVGSGIQLITASFVTAGCVMLGTCHPAQPGALLLRFMIGQMPGCLLAGFVTGKIYRMFKGKPWVLNGCLTAFIVPGFVVVCLVLQTMMGWTQLSSIAIPLRGWVILIMVWWGVMTPMTLMGAYVGHRSKVIEHPVRPSSIARIIPHKQWYQRPMASIVLAGVLPFVVLSMTYHEWLNSIWSGNVVFSMNEAFWTFSLYATTVAEITVVLVFFQLCTEDYNWWWMSFASGAAPSLWMAGYGLVHYLTLTSNPSVVGGLVYAVHMLLGCILVGVSSGALGFLSACVMVRRIYSAVKVD
ncbi:Endomembrane protein 70-domain-containing protein [Phycomyces blakesleeanus]